MDSVTVLIAAFACIIGLLIGWEAGTTQAGRECDRLGGFFTSSAVYECKQKPVLTQKGSRP